MDDFTIAKALRLNESSLAMIEFHEGDVVAKLRENAGMTREELARAASVRPATIGALERTGKCKKDTLQKIAEVLKTSVAEMYSLVPRRPCRDSRGVQSLHAAGPGDARGQAPDDPVDCLRTIEVLARLVRVWIEGGGSRRIDAAPASQHELAKLVERNRVGKRKQGPIGPEKLQRGTGSKKRQPA